MLILDTDHLSLLQGGANDGQRRLLTRDADVTPNLDRVTPKASDIPPEAFAK